MKRYTRQHNASNNHPSQCTFIVWNDRNMTQNKCGEMYNFKHYNCIYKQGKKMSMSLITDMPYMFTNP